MPHLSLAQAKEIRPNLQFRTDNERAAWDQALRQAEADAQRKGTELLNASAQRISEESEAWSAKAIEVTEGMEAVAREAANPGSDFRAVLKVSQDLDAEARALGVWKEQLQQRMTLHNERAADPVAYFEEFTSKWAGNSLTNRDRFLHEFPAVG